MNPWKFLINVFVEHEAYLRSYKPQKVDGLPTDIDVVGQVSQEQRCAILYIFGYHHIAMGPVMLVCNVHNNISYTSSTPN